MKQLALTLLLLTLCGTGFAIGGACPAAVTSVYADITNCYYIDYASGSDSNGGTVSYLRDSTFTPGGTWKLLAGEFKGGAANTSSNYALYVNGAVDSSGTFTSGAATMGTPTTDLMISRYSAANPYGLVGTQDELRFYGGTLSADWLKADYLNQSAPNTFSSFSCVSGCGGGKDSKMTGTSIMTGTSRMQQ